MKLKLLNKAQLLRKQVILPAAAAIVVIAGSSAYALHTTAEKSSGSSQPVASTITTDTNAPSTTTLPADNTQPVAPTTTSTTPPPTAPQPSYGEDPNHPGIYVVFDKTAVMNAAGVPADQQTAALAVVNKIRGDQWIYKMSEDTNVFTDDLLRMTPPKPQDPSVTLPSITEYRDSPVEQLRLANYLANEKYTGWGNVLDILNTPGGTFTR